MPFPSLGPLWRGHLLLFDRPSNTILDSQTGVKLLLIVVAMEGVVRPLLLYGARALVLSNQSWWLMVSQLLLLFITFLLLNRFTNLTRSSLGMYPWGQWSSTEKLYFIQIVPMAIFIFGYITINKINNLLGSPDFLEIGIFKLLPQLIWGFYQEFIYRGLLQTELVRRWGVVTGISVSNLVYTFGPLHAYHFLQAQNNPAHLWIFAATFAIGLFFAILFRRSGNLWMVGIFHGIGDLFLGGVANL